MKFDWTYFKNSDLPKRLRIVIQDDEHFILRDDQTGKSFCLSKTGAEEFTLEVSSIVTGSQGWHFVMRTDLRRLLGLLGIVSTFAMRFAEDLKPKAPQKTD